MAERDNRIGFVAEDFEPDDGSRLTGTFSAHWESDTKDDHGPAPEGVLAEEAIAWAREHAKRVSVLLYDDSSLYSAEDRVRLHRPQHERRVHRRGRAGGSRAGRGASARDPADHRHRLTLIELV
jgi:hypothetical protein